MKARARRWGDKVKETFKGGCEDTDGGETGVSGGEEGGGGAYF